MKYSTIILLIITVILSQSVISQSAWTKKKGEVYSQISYTTRAAYNEFGNDNNDNKGREVIDNTIQLYGEYGINDKFTLLLNVPIKSISTGELTATNTSSLTEESKFALGNIQLGLKRLLYNKKVTISGQLTVEANTSSFDNASGLRTGFDAWTFTPTINLGKGYDKFYFQTFAGVDLRTNDYSSNLRVGGEVGLTFFKKLLLIGFVDVVKSFENGDVILPENNLSTALYINNQEFTAIGFKGVYNFTTAFGITAGYGGAASSSNIGRTPAYTFGAFYKF